MDACRLFRKDSQRGLGGGFTLYINVGEQLECMELHLGMDEELAESLWVRTEGRAGTGDTVGSATGHLTGKTEQMKPSIDK